MRFIRSEDSKRGSAMLAETIVSALEANKSVLWLVSGGSNIPIAKDVSAILHHELAPAKLTGISVTLTDERFGSVGHADSNWAKLKEAGFDFIGMNAVPILGNVNFESTVKEWKMKIASLFKSCDFIVGQFGIGSDGHVAGILPYSYYAHSMDLVIGYDAQKFTRITITVAAMKMIHSAYAFAFGESKREAVSDLRETNMSIDDAPCQALKLIKDPILFSDQLDR